MGIIETIITFVKNIMIIELLKKLIFGSFIRKIFSFFIAITVIPIVLYILELDEKPKWTENKVHYVSSTLTVSVKGTPNDDMKYFASNTMKDEIYKKALKQIKISYDFETLDSATKVKLIKLLKVEIDRIVFSNIKLQDSYKNDTDSYVLYSLRGEYILAILQKIYININTSMLE